MNEDEFVKLNETNRALVGNIVDKLEKDYKDKALVIAGRLISKAAWHPSDQLYSAGSWPDNVAVQFGHQLPGEVLGCETGIKLALYWSSGYENATESKSALGLGVAALPFMRWLRHIYGCETCNPEYESVIKKFESELKETKTEPKQCPKFEELIHAAALAFNKYKAVSNRATYNALNTSHKNIGQHVSTCPICKEKAKNAKR